ncbi:MAG: hypothetical protein RIG84_12710 [Roseovarius sp.]
MGLADVIFLLPVAAGAAALVLQHWLSRRLNPQTPVGDEKEYLGARQTLWVRVPLQGWLMRAAARLTPQRRDLGGRWLTGLLSALSVAGATLWVASEAGPGPALVTALTLLLSVERAVLALHLWPDIAMGALLLAFTWCVQLPSPVAAAVVAALAFGLRIEGLALCVWAAAMPFFGTGMLTPAILSPAAFAPAMIGLGALAVCTVSGGLRTGIWRPDTTFAFNLRAASSSARNPDAPVGQVMLETMRETRQGAARPGLKTVPAILRDIPRRMRNVLGAESFLRHNVLGRNLATYGPAHARLFSGPVGAGLHWGFTATAFATAVVLPLQSAPVIAALLGGCLIYGGLFTRSRYRMALLPLMAVALGLGVDRLGDRPELALAGLAGALALSLLISRARPRREEG